MHAMKLQAACLWGKEFVSLRAGNQFTSPFSLFLSVFSHGAQREFTFAVYGFSRETEPIEYLTICLSVIYINTLSVCCAKSLQSCLTFLDPYGL